MSEIAVDISEGIAVVTLDRPPVNALTMELYRHIAETFEALGDGDGAHCAVFTAAGTRAFCAGLDLNEFLAASADDDPARAAVVRRTFAAVRNCAIPVIAAVNGPALGAGCVLASVCDIRFATDNATFGLPEINVGRCGGGAHLGRLIPQGLLRRMFFTGQAIDAEEAWRAGLVDRIVGQNELLPSVLELAGIVAKKSPLGLRYGKKALDEAEFLPVEEGYAREQEYSTRLMHTEDAKEAARAVVEKRAPVFRGR